MTDAHDDAELHAEQEYVAGLYTRLDEERARARAGYAAALRDDHVSPMDRDVAVRATARTVRRLDVADHGLCFGRLDTVTGERRHLGRIGLHDDADEPVLIDWRAPAARPFYTATAAHPEGVRRRRQFHSRGRRLERITDEALDGAESAGDPDAALLAAVTAPRGAGMRDIVATIRAEQDEIIRLDHPGVTVIEGGPGTGKTVVALHRVAYLLYTQRGRMARHGALVVGPNPAFLRHIDRVLPSLGETDVVFTTTGGLVPGLHATAEDTPEAARAKGSLAILDVLAAAVADRQRLPGEPIPIELGGLTGRIDAETARWARDEARASGRAHHQAREVFVEIVTYVLVERAVGRTARGWSVPEDAGGPDEARAPDEGRAPDEARAPDDRVLRDDLRRELHAELADHEGLAGALDALWPVLTPESLLGELYRSPERLAAAGADPALYRSEGGAWTVSDVPLLDELVDLLGPHPAAERAAAAAERAARRADAEYAEGVMEILTLDREELDEDVGVRVTDLIHHEGLAERFDETDTRDLAERAAVDRDWTYRHVVVDEAQELSAMDWRVLMRRCPGRSFTVVGDLAQRRSPAGATSWAEMLDPYVPGRWAYRSLTVNYRTPAEIMTVAGRVLVEFAPDVRAPESVRAAGVTPWARAVADDDLADAVAAFVADEAGRDGTSVVVGPSDVPGAVPPSQTKGLEFDAVLVVDPQRILDDGPHGAADLYVALTRATQRLGVLHRDPLPPALGDLAGTRSHGRALGVTSSGTSPRLAPNSPEGEPTETTGASTGM